MKLNRKPHSRGEIPPTVSFGVSEPGPRDMAVPNHGKPLASPSSSNFRQTLPVDLKTRVDRSGVRSPASLPSNATRRVKCDKRSISLTTSRNSSVNSLLLGFEDADTFRVDQDQVRCVKASDKRLMAKKRQEIIEIQRLLTHQQKIYISLYAQIKDLEARSGLEPSVCLGEMRLLSLRDWPPHDLLLMVMEHTPSRSDDGSSALESAVIKQLSSELALIPKEVLKLCADLAGRRTKLLEHVRKRMPELKNKNDFDADTEAIHKMIFEIAKSLDTKINRSLELAKTPWKDRDILLGKIDRLNKELCIIKSKQKPEDEQLEIPNNNLNEKNDSRSATELRDKLAKERAARASMKHTVATAEAMLRTARARITVLERELKQAQKQLDASVRKHKEYETLHRCRATSYDVRSKKLLQESKTGEETIEMLSLQRDALELRVKELLEQHQSVVDDYKVRESEHQTNLERLQEKVDEKEKLRQLEEARSMELENCIKEMQEQYRQLKERSEKLIKINSEKCLDFLPQKESEPSQRETELWRDLQETKKTLARVTHELTQSREDKESLLKSLAKIAQEGSENNMANELLLREQKNFQLQRVIENLKENVKSMEETLEQKEKQLNSLRIEASRRNYECCTKATPKRELALEVIGLTAQVANLTREREALVSQAVSRALMLERYERCADLFALMTRARRDVAAQLDGDRRAERPRSDGAFQNAHLPSSLSSSCLKAAKTWEELHTDRERILQLQEVVASQNLQLQRECRIRNQLEQRRAILERLFLNSSKPDKYIPAESVTAYLGTSSYFVNDAFMNAS